MDLFIIFPLSFFSVVHFSNAYSDCNYNKAQHKQLTILSFTFIVVNIIAKAANILPYLSRNFFIRSPSFSWQPHYAIKKKPVRKHVINCGFLVVKCIIFFSGFLFLPYLVQRFQNNCLIHLPANPHSA